MKKTPSFLFSTLQAFVLLASLLSITATQSLCEYIPPQDMVVTTDPIEIVDKNLPLGSYTYSLGWQGIEVGESTLTITKETNESGKEVLKVSAEAKTGKVIDVFYRLRHISTAFIDPETFTPFKFITEQKENSRKKKRIVTYEADGSIKSERWGSKGKKEDIQFKSNNYTLDPITAAVVAKSTKIEVGKKVRLDVFNGKHRFLITFNVLSEETVEINGEKRSAFKVEPQVVRLTNTKPEKRLKKAYLWISNDKKREILKLESKVWVGSVAAKLKGFKPEVKAETKTSIKQDQEKKELPEESKKAQ
jgi:hypothetical protein